MPCWEIIFYEHTQPRDHERGARLLSLPLIIRTLEGSSVMLNGASSGVGALYHGALRILIIKVNRMEHVQRSDVSSVVVGQVENRK